MVGLQMMLAAAGIVALARAVLLFLARDFRPGDLDLDLLRALAAETFDGLEFTLILFGVLVLASRAMRRWSSGLRLAPLIAAIYGILVWEFVSLRSPEQLTIAPGFEGAGPILANVGAAVLGQVIAAVVLLSGLRPGTLERSANATRALGLGLLVVCMGLALTRTTTEDERPNVLLISIDTLRPDHLGAYGYDRETSPNLDAFFASALRFESAYTNHPWTLTAHATMLTGMLPSAHGVNPDRALDPAAPTLPQLLRDEGYRTFAVVDDNDWLHPRFGYARGFERYRRLDPLAPTKVEELLASMDDVAAQGDAPFFAFAHFYDVHSDWDELPYDADPRDQERFAGWYQGDFTGCDPELGCASTQLANRNQLGLPLTGDELEYVRDLYDAGIATLDRQLAELFAGLVERGLDQDTIVILTSDHGEEFFEHGRGLHDQHYNECLQIPLFIRMPGGGAAGVAEELVELADLAPTVLALTGVEARPDTLQGRSLAPLLEGRPDQLEELPGVLMDPGSGAFGLRNRDYAVIRFAKDWYLFDRRTDPGEQDDLYGTGAVDRETLLTLRALLTERRDATLAIGEAYAERPSLAPPPEDVRADLEKLGYVDAHEVEDVGEVPELGEL